MNIGCGNPECVICVGAAQAAAYWTHKPSSTSNADHLRDLALKMEDLCRSHPAYSQAWKVIQNASDHLQAMARCHEVNNLRPGTASSDVNVFSRAYLYNTTKK